jgi:uncharacterized integral membrane protein
MEVAMKYMTLLLILLLSLVLLCFLYLNQGLVTIKYFPGEGHQTPPIPVFAIMMLGIIAGVLMAGVIGFGEQLRLHLRLRQAVRARNDLEQQLTTLKKKWEEDESLEAVLPVSEVAELPPPDQPS